MPIVHAFDWPDRVVVGTVGSPGARSFYLQARTGPRVVSVGLEKQQSALLAEKIDEILDQLMTAEGNPASVPSGTPAELVDNEPLDQPVEPEFRVGGLSLGWDPTTAQIVIEAYPLTEAEESAEDAEPEEMVVLRIPVGTARAFAKRTLEVVGAGRPLCPRCGDPMDPDGHDCPLA
ncbi:DUF3090 domain-containing protein [Rathayibacter sp. ZW T2_19]|uniref:DUF3090 domain-containing protein n=1 Tax=Rathayibacter rubneri TaxID=2950106 RepID=A0A9X2DVD1_9MICO|nr:MULTISPECIES: DUF3090 domain-containing protein [Rathayibacter]MBO0984987.1 DUF3090 domain-containing protein [Rathayibacter sp. SD072]MCM6761452.1 DUF3090 domain-containing protein [Rathayibacter rubneri]